MKQEPISDSFIEKVIATIEKGSWLAKRLPRHGKISIEKQLPYLMVYRYPSREDDAATFKLVLSESSYLLTSRNDYETYQIRKLVKAIANKFSVLFRSFMLFEIWSADEEDDNTFKIKCPVDEAQSTVEILEQELQKVKRLYAFAKVEKECNDVRYPKGFEPLLSLEECKDIGILLIGLQVPSLFKDSLANQRYPLLFRRLQNLLSGVFKKTIYDFIRVQTTCPVSSYQKLGRRTLDRSVWHVDKELAAIEQSYQFLLLISPVNSQSEWLKFRKMKYSKNPEFHYRLLPVDPDELKRRLYKLNLKKIHDSAMAFLLRDKREELDKQITMLGERNSRSFMHNSIRLFNGIENRFVKIAEGLLASLDVTIEHAPKMMENREKPVGAKEFAKKAGEEFDHYRKIYPDFSSRIEVRDDLTGLMVSQGNLLIPSILKISRSRLQPLLQHEVGIHVLTYQNGTAQPFRQLYSGLAGYEELQEGLAVLSEYLVGGLDRPRLRLLAARVVAAHSVMEGAEFVETFRLLTGTYQFTPKTAFGIATRVFQGGGYIGDVIYLRGLTRLMKHLENGGELEPLFIGKIAEKHISVMHELQEREVLKPVPLVPRYLDLPSVRKRLDKVKKGIQLINLLEK
ncbi:MAG: tyrosine/phenylalanine carboxypeptidase domain-containing protein [Bacteroidia bacterium]